MGSGSSSSVSNNILNKTVNKNDLEALNSNVNEFVSNSVIKNTSTCSAGTTQMNDNEAGDITVVGEKNAANLGIDASQDSQVSLECIQNAIMQTNINNDMATGIMQSLSNNVNSDTITKMVNEADASMKQGVGGGLLNPFSNTSSSVQLDLKNIQENETTRKLSNLITNKVQNNQNVSAVKDCFTKTAQQQNNRVGNIKIIGKENTANVNITTKQVAKSFATCQQLTQQTTSTTNDMATTMGLTIKDEATTKQSNESASTAKSSLKQEGFEGIIGAIFGALFAGPIASAAAICCLICCCLLCSYFLFGRKKDSGNAGPPSQDQGEPEPESSPPPPPPEGDGDEST
jgi:hypothetical protein